MQLVHFRTGNKTLVSFSEILFPNAQLHNFTTLSEFMTLFGIIASMSLLLKPGFNASIVDDTLICEFLYWLKVFFFVCISRVRFRLPFEYSVLVEPTILSINNVIWADFKPISSGKIFIFSGCWTNIFVVCSTCLIAPSEPVLPKNGIHRCWQKMTLSYKEIYNYANCCLNPLFSELFLDSYL